MQVTVLGFSEPPLNRPRNTLSVASVAITFDGNHTIKLADLRVIRNRNQELWIGMPSLKNAQGAYLPIVELSRELRHAVEGAVITAYEKWSLGQQTAQQEVSRG